MKEKIHFLSIYRLYLLALPLYCIILSKHLYHPLCRKLLEGEETRIGTGISGPNPYSGQNYSYQTRIYSSSPGKTSKKESKDEEQQSKSGVKVYEETVVTTKKMEKQQDSNDIPTNQKN